MGLWYPKDISFELTAFLDSDHVGCLDSQDEYVSLSTCCAQVLWMRTQLTDYGFHFDKILITEYQLADLFTKALPEERFKYLVRRLGVIDSGCSRHMAGNMSYLSDFKELNGGYVAFGGNPKGGKFYEKEKAGEEIVQQYVLFPFWSSGSTNPKNTDGDAAFDEKEPEFEGKKLESKVNVSPSSSAQSKKHEDKTKREAKGKNLVESLTGYRNLSAEFEDFSNNNINEDNATKLEDITYSDDEDDVSADADFTNLETSITVFRNKKDERGIVVRNKARLVTQGHTQEEGIDYEEVFSPVARIEAIRLFLAYASFMGFMVYQMDVKSVFLYGTIKEEALYSLHQAPRAWYETLANYLLENGFQRGKIDQTLFIKRQKGDILLVQIYVDNIIFGSINKDLSKAFEKLMKDKFQMSSIGEITFFFGLQVKQEKDGIFISQDKYLAEILRKFGLTNGKSASTPIDTEKPFTEGS
nr:putative ribonuclease H-like domain-containing protein [Tanacetum cinerariifolium]